MTKAIDLVTRVPFSGFYESIWSEQIDHEEDSHIEYEAEYRQEEEGIPAELRLDKDELWNIYYRHTSYDIAYRALAKDYCEAFGEAKKSDTGIDLKLRFESMDSPKEYNFTTDRVYAHIPLKVVQGLFAISKAEKHQRLQKRIAESFTSRSGFISFYPATLEDEWLNPVKEWDHNQLCTLIEAICGDCDDWEPIFYAFGDEAFYTYWSDSVDWEKVESDIAELRAEKLAEITEENPDYVPPYRCTETADLFAAH